MSHNLVNIADLNGLPTVTPEQWALFIPPGTFTKMPLAHRDQILFLDVASTQTVYDAANRRNILCGNDGFGNTPFSAGCFRHVEAYSIQAEAELKKWLYQRGIPFASAAFVLPVFAADSSPAVLTTWKMIVKYAFELFGSDDIVVVSDKVDWCVYFRHCGTLKFASEPDRTKFW
ncbi:MAG: hypothetical protein AAGE59_07515 [Cyanobacteria bacterium P01_F01_bin.86]